MNLNSKIAVENLLGKYGIRPFKGWGQNFLINEGILKKIIEAANLDSPDVVLEIGPGVGTLTQELTKRAKKVVAVEKDRKMVQILKEVTGEYKNIEIIQEDILKIKNLKLKNYKVVANLPYNIASATIRKFLESENPPKEMILMVQKEVAQRICAKAPDMNILAISVQFYSKPEILFYVSKSSFWPKPKVDGAVIKLKPRNKKWKIDKKLFFKIVKAGFSQPRKQILNNLSKMLKLNKEETAIWLKKCNIRQDQRAETLKIKDWLKLVKNYTIQ